MRSGSSEKVLVTGGAGFIGSHVVDRLLADGHEVVVFDNMTSGKMEFIAHHLNDPHFKLINGDLLQPDQVLKACNDVGQVFHLAANPDVRIGASNTRMHFDQNVLATYNLLDAMHRQHVKEIAFTSSSTIYGQANIVPTPEDYGPLVPISMYGASKLACEAMITAYCHTFDMRSWIFRFANIIGDRGTHGIIVDFIHKLKRDPAHLEILGDGKQSKSYLHVRECVDAMMLVVLKGNDQVNIFNIGSEDTISATRIGEIVAEEMAQDPEFKYTGGSQGWKGDVPKMMLSIEKLKALGWKPGVGSEESVRVTARSLLQAMA
ncbi:MAG: UDP-galactose-4-epimerase [Methanomethylovorans sp. PtaU1.Bin093]|uniref:NAD-dependent epimerase/dehydratase family protein n=1 Tax=Methanomethylovorans sp. PtaU1.Bin093 TaxID=1811679 RepID=UPI0009C68AD1|nr:NAD-dependent epimerase/dehydratase family protein [Methanomethylovorans sp. PtaU1.Bin093]OPY22279.1 MAG: UDP-galactose-4-epimerase [Methanomethylovorans sp. PtaU1.Bin093]